MISPGLPPFALFFAAALLLPMLGLRMRAALLLLIPLLGMLNLLALSAEGTDAALALSAEVTLRQSADGFHGQWSLFGLDLTMYRVDRLSLLFGWVFHVAALLFGLFALHVKDRMESVAALVYVGSSLGAVFAGDLITLLIFWELLTLSSVFLVWARRTDAALGAGLRYLIIQLLSGLLLLVGALVQILQTGSAGFEFIGLDGGGGASQAGAWLILLAFGIKCGFPPFHNLLTDAYPESTATGTVYISAFTTVVAVYALARGFPGTTLLIYMGALMALFPIFYAVIENDLRRVLCYSAVNQLGFMVCGIGIGTELAVNGAVAHAVNNVIFKGLLMMAMGAVLYRTGTCRATDLGGLYRSMPLTTGFCIVGAAAISAFPLFSGFISKTMILSAALAEQHDVVWLVLLFASAGVFHHAGIKIPFFAFFAEDSGICTREPPRNMLLAMGASATLCILIGCWPGLLYALLPFELEYVPYTSGHVIAQLQLLFFSALAFIWLRRSGIYPPERVAVNIDAEWMYRYLGPRLCARASRAIAASDRNLRDLGRAGARRFIRAVAQVQGPTGPLVRNWQTGSMVLLLVALLGGWLIVNAL